MKTRIGTAPFAGLLTVVALSGCASAPPPRTVAVPPVVSGVEPATVAMPAGPAVEALTRARGLLGVPYRFGGADPSGLDCSGLVHFVYRESGVLLPRTAEAQQGVLIPVERHALAPGDLVFFRLPEPHVGIYAGGDEFIHAPGSGRGVEVARLDQPWFILGFAGAGRVAGPVEPSGLAGGEPAGTR
jgi:cell wall-associated NlpC family hydrolase